jgi:ABC-2 type transport system ATP-binding protein
MKRKVALLQVLMPRAPLLILDEPTNTLDPTMRDELLDQLRQARGRGQAVLFSSHVLTEVEKVCDRVGILQGGRLVHLQDMSALREVRLVKARFPRPPSRPGDVAGVRCAEQSGDEVALEYVGPLPPLLDWLARHQASDLTIVPLGLGPIYHRYHGGEA